MKKILIIAFVALLGLGVMAPQAKAGEVDLLVQKLVEKGILTPGEAQTLVTETKEQVKAEIAAGKNESLPTWLQTMKLKGDFRMRYQYDRSTAGDSENRARIRARLGVEAKVNDKMKAGIGIATGKTSDQRSTNITLGQSGGTEKDTPGSFKSIVLDYAYGEYAFNSNASVIAGKFSNPLWRVSDLLWDSDINPEGVGFKMTHKLSSSTEFFMNDLFFFLGEDTSKESKYPMMFAIQPGLSHKINDNYSLKGAIAGYIFSGVEKRTTLGGTPSTGSTNTFQSSKYKYNYNSINPSMELSIKDPLNGLVPYAAIFGEGIFNVSQDVESSKSGFSAGVKFGAEKVSDKGQWQARMLYGKLGRDAWMDVFPDSDRYSGATNMKSYEAALAYGLGKNTYLELDYYYSQSLSKVAESASGPAGYRPSHLLQLDWNLKF